MANLSKIAATNTFPRNSSHRNNIITTIGTVAEHYIKLTSVTNHSKFNAILPPVFCNCPAPDQSPHEVSQAALATEDLLLVCLSSGDTTTPHQLGLNRLHPKVGRIELETKFQGS